MEPERPVEVHHERRCPMCGSRRIEHGRFTGYRFEFAPSRRRGRSSFLPKGFACLECGYLGHYLGLDDLEELRRADGSERPLPEDGTAAGR